MASACVTSAGMVPETFLDCPPAFPSYIAMLPSDFEFRIDDPVAMLPADELFSGGKLVPRHLAAAHPAVAIRLPEPRSAEILPLDASATLSPKAPSCSSRWRELFSLKRQQKQGSKPEHQKAAASAPSKSPNPKPLKRFLPRSSKSYSAESSLSLQLIRDSDSESVSLSSRPSLSSSSSSGPDHEDLPRISLDSDKHSQAPIYPPRVRVSRRRPAAARSDRSPVRRPPEVSAESPRMNSSGRVVFQGLERSASSPGSFNGGPRASHQGVQRSYSTGIRVVPVLNVPVFGLGKLFSSHKKEREITAPRVGGGGGGGGREGEGLSRTRWRESLFSVSKQRPPLHALLEVQSW